MFNFSWEKEIDPYGSGDDGDYGDDDDDGDDDGDGYIFTTPVPTRALLSSTAAAHLRTTGSPSMFTTRNLSLVPNRTVTRLPPRFTPSPGSRHSSFQHLLRLHMNTFNQRLSMLEKNTLDMKESIQRMEEQQKLLSAQLAQLISVRAAEAKGEKVGELERSYTDMETRLHRLEGRLEILIDGFTALAQEMNKMKRARHSSRSPPERRELPSLATVRPLPLYPSAPPPVPSTVMPFSSRAPAPEGTPTPGLTAARTSTSGPRQGRKRKPAVANTSTPPLSVTKPSKSPATTSSAATLTTTRSQSTAKSTAKPEATTAEERRRSAATSKRVSKTSNAKAKGAQKEAAVTAFQLEPPSHNSKPDQTRRKNSTSPSKGNARNKAFRSDEPDPKKTREAATVPEGNAKELAEPREGDAYSDPDHRKTDPGAQGAPRKTNSSTRRAITAAKPAKATAAAQKSSTAAGSKSTSPKAKATVAKKKTLTGSKRKSVTPKSKKNSGRKVSSKKSQQKTSNVMDLLQLLSGDRKSAKQTKNGESSLHVVLGRLAIPIKIIPDF